MAKTTYLNGQIVGEQAYQQELAKAEEMVSSIETKYKGDRAKLKKHSVYQLWKTYYTQLVEAGNAPF